MSTYQFLPQDQQLSLKSLVETFKQVKASFGVHYPSKHSVLQALSAALEKCDSKDLHIIAFQLDIEHKQMSDTKLRLEIQKHVFYKLYNASIHSWNVSVTSGITVIIILLIQKLLKYTSLDSGILSPLNTLLSVAYITIGSVALAGIFFRWMQSKNLRGKVLKLVDQLKSGTLRKSYLRNAAKEGSQRVRGHSGDKQPPPKYSPPRKQSPPRKHLSTRKHSSLRKHLSTRKHTSPRKRLSAKKIPGNPELR